jgi:hypothetical protein
MPALTLSTEDAALDVQATSPATALENERDGSSSPARPSYSPITPVFPSASLVGTAGTYQHGSPQSSVPPLPAAPLSESENSDAIALRSAISILQLQRQQSVRDLQKLEKQKHDAVAHSNGFAEELVAGRISMGDNGGLIGLPLISNTTRTSEESAIEEDLSDSGVRDTPTQTPRFGPIPTPQNIVRCPPINWAKYHVIGDSLHKLHEEQRLRPASGEPQKDEPRRAPVHVIAAPYRPFEDKIADPPMRTRSTSKKG